MVTGDGIHREPVLAVERIGDASVVRLAGELDLHNVAAIRAALTEAATDEKPRVVVDLTLVEFMDSTTLGALVEARKRLSDGTLLLAAPGLQPRRALTHAGLDRHFTVAESVDEALASSAPT